MRRLVSVTAVSLVVLAPWLWIEDEAWARAGRGGSSGSRGSRTHAAPVSHPSSSRAPAPSGAESLATTTSAAGSGLGGMVGGLVAGGLLGSLFFGGSGGGFGITDLAVFGLIVFFLLRKMRAMQAAPIAASVDSGSVHAMTLPARGSAYARGSDSGFVSAPARRPEPVLDAAEMSRVVTDIFLKVQAAWMARDMEQAGQVLTPEMRANLQKDCDQMRAQGRINRLENVLVRSAEVTETWQEPGRDFVTVRVEATLRDEIVDEQTGEVLEGGATEPVTFQEYWTLTRAVWVKAWRLSAIQQPAVTSA